MGSEPTVSLWIQQRSHFFSCRRGDDDFHISMVFTGNGISRSFAFDQFGFADDEQRSQLILPLAEEIIVFAIGIDSDSSVESMADLVFFTSAFEDTRQIAAVRQELSQRASRSASRYSL